jgi:recombination DNA repair RAD52 pathway protein
MTPPFGARNELSIPEKVRGDKSAAELIRAWVTANGDVHVTIKTDVWQDPAAYGIVLADLARHIANGFNQSQGKDVDDALRRVVEGFSAEVVSPTDTPTGQIQQP